jgi:hypothetical protein
MRLSAAKPALLIWIALLAPSCSAVQGYPDSPENTTVVLQRLKGQFDPNSDAEQEYYGHCPRETCPPLTIERQRQLRDFIVYSRLRAYDIEFDEFERSLFQDSNLMSTGSDLAVLALNGLAATTGTAQIKSGLSAASAGIVGAQGAINKDLYYQRTLPALLSQMTANRSKIELDIFGGLRQPDADYPLARAQIDLDALGRAGSVPHAIAGLTQQAVDENAKTQARIDSLRVGVQSHTKASQTLLAWVFPNGPVDANGKVIPPDPTRVNAIQDWMQRDKVDPALQSIPWYDFVTEDDPGLEADRLRALSDPTLKIQGTH